MQGVTDDQIPQEVLEGPKLSEQTAQRIHYFMNGADKDGFEITTIQHLMFAAEFVRHGLRRDMGADAEAYFEQALLPQYHRLKDGILNRES